MQTTPLLRELLHSTLRVIHSHPVGGLHRTASRRTTDLLWVGPAVCTPDGRHVVMILPRWSNLGGIIRLDPFVHWTFSDPDAETIVTLAGTARLAEAHTLAGLLPTPAHLPQSTMVLITDVQTIHLRVPTHGIDLQTRLTPDWRTTSPRFHRRAA